MYNVTENWNKTSSAVVTILARGTLKVVSIITVLLLTIKFSFNAVYK